jgi:VanZ family protein
MNRTIVSVAAWACLVFIVYATLTSLNARPELSRYEPAMVVFLERFGAYALLGVLFCAAYPGRLALVCVLVLGTAVFLEFSQLLTPDRDARIIDAVEKLAGGVVGISIARTFLTSTRRHPKT